MYNIYINITIYFLQKKKKFIYNLVFLAKYGIRYVG